MTQDLHRSLDDLVAEVPAHVEVHALARTAWTRGRRRRHLRQVGALAAVLAVLGLAAGLVPVSRHLAGLAPAGGGAGSSAVSGYPERIGHRWWVPDIPARPGPMALLMQRVSHHGTYDLPAGWESVSQAGTRWRLPVGGGADDMYPTLSPTGRQIGYLQARDGPYVIRDLVTGNAVSYSDIGSNASPGRTRFLTYDQHPSFWSPDGQQLVMSGSARRGFVGRGLLLGPDGSTRLLRVPGSPVGWVDDNSIAWLALHGTAPARGIEATVLVTDPSGSVLRRVALHSSVKAGFLSQWSGVVSPDGAQILLTQHADTNPTIQRFSMTTGQPLGAPTAADDMWSPCDPAWRGTTPVVNVIDGTQIYPVAVTPTGAQRLVAIEPRLGAECVVWAEDALAGTVHGSVLGTSMTWWTWWWRELSLALIVGVSLAWFGAQAARVRRTRRRDR